MVGRKKVLIPEDEREMMGSFLEENIYTAMTLGGVSRQKYENKLQEAQTFIMSNCVVSYAREAAWVDRFVEIPGNMSGLIDLFKTNAFSAHDAVVAALTNPQLFMQPYEETVQRVEEGKKRLCGGSLEMQEKEIFPFYVDKPRMFSYTPETIEQIFKLKVMFLESPYVAFRDNSFGSYFRRQRVDTVKSQFGSVSDTLLRMAAAEMSFRDPGKFGVSQNLGVYFVDTTSSFHRPKRETLEKNIVECLGFHGKGNVMDTPSDLLTKYAQNKIAQDMKMTRDCFIDASIKAFDEMPRPTQPRKWPIPVFTVINNDNADALPKTAAESQRVRAQMVLGGFLKKYKLTTVPGF